MICRASKARQGTASKTPQQASSPSPLPPPESERVRLPACAYGYACCSNMGWRRRDHGSQRSPGNSRSLALPSGLGVRYGLRSLYPYGVLGTSSSLTEDAPSGNRAGVVKWLLRTWAAASRRMLGRSCNCQGRGQASVTWTFDLFCALELISSMPLSRARLCVSLPSTCEWRCHVGH